MGADKYSLFGTISIAMPLLPVQSGVNGQALRARQVDLSEVVSLMNFEGREFFFPGHKLHVDPVDLRPCG